MPSRPRVVHALAAFAFVAQFVAMDVALAGPRSSASFATSALASVCVWSLGLAVAHASARAGRAVVAASATAIAVLQLHVYRYYHVPLDIQVAASAIHAWNDVRAVALRGAGTIALATIGVGAVEWALLGAGRRVLDAPLVASRGRARRAAVAAAAAAVGVVALLGVAPREATPDIRAAHALGAVGDVLRRDPHGRSSARARAQAEAEERPDAVSLPPIHPDRVELPSVLFVLTESVRADDYEPSTAPGALATGPGRVDLRQMRSISSYTAVSLSALLTGRSQEGAREDVLRAPSLFDFAHAARDPATGRRMTVAYVSAQSAEVFETKDVRAAVDRFATIETFTGKQEVEDDESADRFAFAWLDAHLAEIPAPRLVVLHLVDTHAPYVVDERAAPFEPYDHVVAWSRMSALHNAYKDAIYTQDRAVAKTVRAFTEAARGPWLVLFTSDHGEAFGEHGAIHHGQNLFDEQVHVPAWILSGRGALSREEDRALAEHATRFVTHLDVLPTILDAMGLWDNFAVAPHRAAMRGKSLLRPWEPRGAIPVTNCTGMFPCPSNTWGVYEDDRKLVARIYDGGFACLALAPTERPADADDPACGRLRDVSKRVFPLLPNGQPNR